MSHTKTVALAGATGDLGARITQALVARGATVRALIRPETKAGDQERLKALGAELAAADPGRVEAMAEALGGVDVVVSALNGLREVIMDRQGVLLKAAIRAGVPRFMPSDFSEDFTKITPGQNRNLDLRRDFMALVDASPIKATSILNGAFMDMLGDQMPLLQPRLHKVLYWENADQLLDFTTKDDVAAYTAAAALDEETPRILRIAGDSVSARQLARVLTEIDAHRWRPLWVGNIGMLSGMIAIAKRLSPDPNELFPAWQGMQYMRDMFSGAGKLRLLDSDRYPEITWTRVNDHLAWLKSQGKLSR